MSSKSSIRLKTARFDSALAELRELSRKGPKGARNLVRQQSRGFVRRVVAITPPGSAGVTGGAAKKQGEAAVKADLAKLFVGVRLVGKRRRRTERHPELGALHLQHRNNRGRVTGRPRYRVDKRKLAALAKVLLSRVGWLAAGWNAAAQKLGVTLPAWVRRHGNSAGSIQIRDTPKSFSIVMRNEVGFADQVEGLKRRCQAALDYQAAAMERQIPYIIEKCAQKAGFRVR